MPALAFITFSQLVRLIAERTGGDGLSALIAAASSGRIVGESQWRESLTGNPPREDRRFKRVPARWWAAIGDPTPRRLGWQVHVLLATDSLVAQRVHGYHPGTEFPASQTLWEIRNIRFSQEKADELWPPSSAKQEPPPAPVEPSTFRDEVENIVAAVVADLEQAGLPPAQERVWKGDDKSRNQGIKSVSERLAPTPIRRQRVRDILAKMSKTLEKHAPTKSSSKPTK